MRHDSTHPNLKRARTSDTPSPSSTSSPKRAPSEDAFASSSATSESGAAAAINGLLTPGLRGDLGPGSSPLRMDVDGDTNEVGESEGEGEWVRLTEGVHLADSAEGDLGVVHPRNPEEDRAKYRELYNELLSHTPPPFNPWAIYYILPSAFRDDLKVLAFGSDAKDAPAPAELRLDITPLLRPPAAADEATTSDGVLAPWRSGEDIWVPGVSGSGDTWKYNGTVRLEKLWELRPGLAEDEDFCFVAEEGWKKISEQMKYSGPVLPRFCKASGSIQMEPPIYTIYTLAGDSTGGDAIPIHFTCPSDTSLFDLVGLLTTALAESSTAHYVSNSCRVFQFDPSLAIQNNDPAALRNLAKRSLSPDVVVGLNSKLIADGAKKTDETCADKNLESGDSLVLEVGSTMPGSMPGRSPQWSVDVNGDGNAMIKGFVANLPEVPLAPPPLFSKPAFYGGSGDGSSSMDASTSSLGVTTRSQSRQGSRKGKGLVGLVNLGNTCFMNSAVQCLSNTIELNDYFLSGVYRDELNRDNPLGMGGAIADAFGGVIENLWTNTSPHGSFAPRQLKSVTSRFAPQFAGYGQHDTQEFIAFLLDGLHEDLNRIKKKPYIEKPDWKAGGGDRELAALGKECWEGYKKRNDSVIVDLFQGQLQSTLVCPECHKESITMDPFMYLTVPLPIAQYRTFKFHYFAKNTKEPPKLVKLLIGQNASFAQVKEKLAAVTKCNPNNLVMYDHWKHAPYAWLADADHNGEAKDSDEIHVHEVGAAVVSTRKAVGTSTTVENTIIVPVYTALKSEGRYRSEPVLDLTLQPFFITLSKADASDPVKVREAITKGYSRFVRSEAKDHLWVPQGSSKAATHLQAILPDDDDSPVTEIHLDGGETRIVEVPPGSPGMDVDHQPHDQPPRVPSRAPSPKVDYKPGTKLVPRGDLFKVHVAEASSADGASSLNVFKSKDPNVIPFYKGSVSSASAAWSTLENRKKTKKAMFNRIASNIGSMMTGYNSEDDASPPATPSSPPLVVRAGEGVFCEWSSKKYHEFFDGEGLQGAEVLEDPAIAKEKAKKALGKAIGIEDCLDEFSKEETLGQDDLWYCPVCKKHQAATKKLEIYKAPDILVICIKRFGSSRRMSDKLDNLVNFPVDGLDLEERIGERKVAKTLNLSDDEAQSYGIESTGESMMYDLYAVDNHFGGLGGGHYTSFCRNREDGEWYNYDDSRVSRASADAIQSRAAYLLFYRRRAARPIGGISRIKAEEASRAASRIATPEPGSPVAGPSTLSHEITGDADTPSGPPSPSSVNVSSLSDPEESPPDYSPPSPLASIGVDANGDEPMHASASTKSTNEALGKVGSSLGFGNTSWGLGSANPSATKHDFANSADPSASSQGAGLVVGTPESDDSPLSHLQTTSATTATGGGRLPPSPPMSDDEMGQAP